MLGIITYISLLPIFLGLTLEYRSHIWPLLEMQSVQEIDDIVNDESRNLDNVLIFGDDDNDGDRVNISDQVNVASNCEYFTESEYIDYLKTEKTSDDSHFKIVSLNIANIL